MHIPEHINFNGDPIVPPPVNGRVVTDRERVMEMMNVPDRILVTGGGGYQGFDAEPLLDLPVTGKRDQPQPIVLNDLPTRLTIAEVPYPEEPTVDNRSNSSIAIDENPLQELKLMRRQVVRMNNRLYELEEQVETRKVREKQLWITIAIGFAASLLTIIFRR